MKFGLDQETIDKLNAMITPMGLEQQIMQHLYDAEEKRYDPPQLQDVMTELSANFGFSDDVLEPYIEVGLIHYYFLFYRFQNRVVAFHYLHTCFLAFV